MEPTLSESIEKIKGIKFNLIPLNRSTQTGKVYTLSFTNFLKENDPKKVVQPTLYRVNIRTNDQKKVSSPPKEFGDFYPYFLQRHMKLTWIRTDLKHADVWISNQDGSDAKEFIKNIDWGTAFHEGSNWGTVIDWYEPHD